MENTTQENVPVQETETKKPKTIKIDVRTAVIIGCVVAFFLVAFLARGYFVAATVNGSPISRLSVIQELEKQGGKTALDSLITQKLIENEANKQNIVVSEEELNAEMQKIEAQVTAQGGTLEQALAQQGMTVESLRNQVRIQQQMQKLLGDKVTVTDEEVQKYITDSKATIPAGEEESAKEQIRDQIRDQKLNQEAQVFITNLRNDAKIKYYVNY
jgi:foldase protein PrsA